MSDESRVVIKQKTVVAQVMEQIRDLIASGKYSSGDRIPTEHELAERFGIGRSSIREAVRVFNYLGILESKAAKGTFVADSANISSEALTWAILLGKNELFNMVEMRGALEVWTLKNLKNTEKDNPGRRSAVADELEEVLEHMKIAIGNKSIEELIKSDYNFHHVIIKSSGNDLFMSIYNVLRDFMFEEIKATYVIFDSYDFAIQEHMAIISSVRGTSETEPEDAMIKHINDITGRLKQFRDEA